MPPFLSSLDVLFAVGGVVPLIALGFVVYGIARGQRPARASVRDRAAVPASLSRENAAA